MYSLRRAMRSMSEHQAVPQRTNKPRHPYLNSAGYIPAAITKPGLLCRIIVRHAFAAANFNTAAATKAEFLNCPLHKNIISVRIDAKIRIQRSAKGKTYPCGPPEDPVRRKAVNRAVRPVMMPGAAADFLICRFFTDTKRKHGDDRILLYKDITIFIDYIFCNKMTVGVAVGPLIGIAVGRHESSRLFIYM